MPDPDDLDFARHADELRAKLGRVSVWWSGPMIGPAQEARDAAAEIEQLGYSALWYGEAALTKDAFAAAGILLSATSTLQIATGVANIWSRAAPTMVAGAAALGEAFDDRLVLGIGVSHAPLVAMFGQEYNKPLTAMRTYLDAMDEAPYIGARPAGGVRRLLAALRPKMLRLSAERSAGAHPYFVPVEHTAQAREILGPQPLLAPEQAFVLEIDVERARAVAREHLGPYLGMPNYTNNLRDLGYGDEDFADGGSNRLADAIVVWGDADAIAGRVQAHLDAGADHVGLQPLGDAPTARAALRAIAPTVLDL